jgi:hypothetical protein
VYNVAFDSKVKHLLSVTKEGHFVGAWVGCVRCHCLGLLVRLRYKLFRFCKSIWKNILERAIRLRYSLKIIPHLRKRHPPTCNPKAHTATVQAFLYPPPREGVEHLAAGRHLVVRHAFQLPFQRISCRYCVHWSLVLWGLCSSYVQGYDSISKPKYSTSAKKEFIVSVAQMFALYSNVP